MISKEEVKHIAELARIGVSEKDVEKFSRDLSAVLDWIEELKKADIEGISEVSHISGMENSVREDKVEKFLEAEKIIELFPEKKERYDKVKSIF
jgi:aspartyl-tRNA(Asn)/glutamyl-tRNA(Gln) amidotransferase subunit C